MLNGSELNAEGKGKDFRKFRSVATITITGNHKPAFVTSSEESGIDRRLPVLEINKKIAEHMPDDTRFAEKIVRDEGRAILMFFIQGAMEGWQNLERTGSFMGDTVKEALDAARGYRRAANHFLQWIKEDMELGEEFDYESKACFKDFVTHMREQNPKFHMSKEDFRTGMEALGLKYDRRSTGKVGVDRNVFKGLTPREDRAEGNPFGEENSGKVLQFPKPK
jgi:phage/plasmid-associated DNA primase